MIMMGGTRPDDPCGRDARTTQTTRSPDRAGDVWCACPARMRTLLGRSHPAGSRIVESAA